MPKITLLTSEDSLPAGYVPATRINYSDYTDSSLYDFIRDHCVKDGKPLVISNFHKSTAWNNDLFTLKELKSLTANKTVEFTYRDSGITTKKMVLFSDYVDDLQKRYNLTLKHKSKKLQLHQQSRIFKKIYAKDIDCPLAYKEAINNIIPDYLLPHGYNDLFSYTPERVRAENLMCYLGQDGTGTPLHQDLCGTMGHNIMVSGSPDGYAEWIIVENRYRDRLAELLKPTVTEMRNIYGHEDALLKTTRRGRTKLTADSTNADSENDSGRHLNMMKNSFLESDRAWLTKGITKKSNIPVHVIIQKPGDLVLIPSRAYHQVRNKGVTLKIAWNRITAQTLAYAFKDQLPLYKIINRPETYKCKGIVAFTVKEWNERLAKMNAANLTSASTSSTTAVHDDIFKCGYDDFKRNSKLLAGLLLKDVIAPELLYDDDMCGVVTDSNSEICSIRCDFCYSDIFHRYYHCEICDQYDLCLDCYSIGRSCQHPDSMKMHQSCVSVDTYITLYYEFVRNLKLFFNEDLVEPGLGDSIFLLNARNASNLATTCRRIERYRRLKSDSFNVLECSHCGLSTDVLKLEECGISLSSVFQRGPCQSLQVAEKDEQILKIYVCINCTSKCRNCSTLCQSEKPLVDFNLVYYVHPKYDTRNKGGFIDSTILKTCDSDNDKARADNSRTRKRGRPRKSPLFDMPKKKAKTS